ncbi:DUF4124 domain-containing protein [Stutzerimonas chloritidismutans]|uniref:DUF4124 domain-containing protein n=1 Tax=Stutzerimonas chloritidismutans TaxID=203192 RepID=UPI003F16BDC3
MRIALLSLLVLLSAPAMAQIYKYTDERGNTVFTNQPPEGVAADQVKLPPANTVDIRTPEPPPPLSVDTQEKQEQPYASLAIGGIPDEEALRANNGSFMATAEMNPPLRSGHLLRFLLDGTPLAAPSASTSMQLNNVDRGTHRLEVEVLANGQVIQRTSQTFTVQRVHTSSPGR